MVLHIKKLIICDEFDNILYKSGYERATTSLKNALRYVNQKEGGESIICILKEYLTDLDKEFQEYFRLK